MKKDRKNISIQQKELWSFALSIFAVTVSVASLVFSFWIYTNSQKEVLIVDFSPLPSLDHVILRESPMLGFSGRLDVFWNCLITNSGAKQLSVVSHQIFQNTDEGKIQYTGLDGGLFDQSGEQIYLPITLAVGESVRLFVRVGLLVDSTAYSVLTSKFEIDTVYSKRDMHVELAKSGVDIYGNEVDYRKLDEGRIISGPKIKGSKGQIIEISFRTGKGRVFRDSSLQFGI